MVGASPAQRHGALPGGAHPLQGGDEDEVLLLFPGGGGRFVPDGWLPSGCVAMKDASLNLHEPGVVRGFVDEAARRGLLDRSADLDGWELFRAVASALGRQAS